MAGYIPFSTVETRLQAARSIWLATSRPDGRPHVVPVWFHWDGRVIYFNVAPGSRKLTNLEQQRWAVAHLGDGDDVFIAEGPAAVVEAADELTRVDAAYRHKYVDPYSGATAGYPESGTAIPYRLDVHRFMTWVYGVVATRTDFLPDTDGQWVPIVPGRI